MTLRETIMDAFVHKKAIGHFNISNSEMLDGVWEAAKELNVPVIIGVSEGERDFIGIERVVAMVKSLRETYKYPIFLNADHTYSVERVKEAIDAGFDSVIFDGVKMSTEENIEKTKECVQYARSSGRDVVVEAELGFIGQSSKILDAIPDGAAVTPELMTTPEEAARFVTLTNVDMLAPAVGNVHGMVRSGLEPALNTALVKEIQKATGVPLVLHGGSGNNESEVKKAIENGVAVVHISTELRVAFRKGLENDTSQKPDEVAPYKYESGAVEGVKDIVLSHLKRFS